MPAEGTVPGLGYPRDGIISAGVQGHADYRGGDAGAGGGAAEQEGCEADSGGEGSGGCGEDGSEGEGGE